MPDWFRSADPTRLWRAITVARERGVNALLISKAEAALEKAEDKAPEVRRRGSQKRKERGDLSPSLPQAKAKREAAERAAAQSLREKAALGQGACCRCVQ